MRKLHVYKQKREHNASPLKRIKYSILGKRKLLSYKQLWSKL